MGGTSDRGTSSSGTPDTPLSLIDISEAPVGLSDPQYVQRKRKMLDAVNRLRAIGAHLDLDIPVIVVLGSQSAGKSSLIEAISGITLPRASGVQQNASFRNPWNRGVASYPSTLSKTRTASNWAEPAESHSAIPFLTKPLVTERIRRAQGAILNPNTPNQSFLEADVPEERQLSFSSNSVCLGISGRDVDDLSFVDLPGLIPGGNPHDSKLVEHLAKQYISKDSCIILLTIACETDLENQGAHSLAAKYDPQGSRTIGVLTKPDRIPAGEEGGWIRMIQGHTDSEESGIEYFSVKNPDSQDIKNGITYEQARKKEVELFATQAPWSNLDWLCQQRLGTERLTRHLGGAL